MFTNTLGTSLDDGRFLYNYKSFYLPLILDVMFSFGFSTTHRRVCFANVCRRLANYVIAIFFARIWLIGVNENNVVCVIDNDGPPRRALTRRLLPEA